MKQLVAFSFFVFSFFVFTSFAQTVIPGHAHNDYLNKPALYEALESGLVSVEADVHLMKGELYVAHVRPLGRNKKRSLENLYLKPLFEHVQKNGRRVYPNYGGPFYLMIDFKGGGMETFNRLTELLGKYRSMLTVMEDGELKPGAVTVFLSGGRPTEGVLNAEPKLAFLDGRPSDIGQQIPAEVMPVISDNYHNHLSWNGVGEMPSEEQLKLRKLVSKVHAEGKKLRLWASPDNPNAWESFQKIGIDLINTNTPKKFAEEFGKSET
ncbi:MAG: phosphatidylinositol-specific phospholipase C/glycerophosphodiester phosphodiesterase family protein [Flavobacteriales bacterium]|nr:phosphatidylinositol-specific phospholipase C/glycerophosphodiester phosphodiesterase family protein [Flavobacteriales bacterium]